MSEMFNLSAFKFAIIPLLFPVLNLYNLEIADAAFVFKISPIFPLTPCFIIPFVFAPTPQKILR